MLIFEDDFNYKMLTLPTLQQKIHIHFIRVYSFFFRSGRNFDNRMKSQRKLKHFNVNRIFPHDDRIHLVACVYGGRGGAIKRVLFFLLASQFEAVICSLMNAGFTIYMYLILIKQFHIDLFVTCLKQSVLRHLSLAIKKSHVSRDIT